MCFCKLLFSLFSYEMSLLGFFLWTYIFLIFDGLRKPKSNIKLTVAYIKLTMEYKIKLTNTGA